MKDKSKYVCGSLTKDEIIHILNERNKLLVKALDKACEELSRLNNDLDRRVITTSTYWKEYLLKEVQENE